MIFDKNEKCREHPGKQTKEELFKRQKHTLDLFLERNARALEETPYSV